MNATNYFLPMAADQVDLSAWAPILPESARILRTSLFGDVFLIDASGAVHMLERAGCSATRIAASEGEFWTEVQDDEQGWQLRPLADACRSAGKKLSNGECYAFTTPPVLGGHYTVENIRVSPWEKWFLFTADLFQQIRDFPDGTTVTLKIVD